MIFDEPTSFIDPLSEDELFDTIINKAQNNLIILITHRLYNLKKVDKILVLDEGKVIEMGSFSDLMAKRGQFFQMFSSQN